MIEPPRYEHNCPDCIYLGQFFHPRRNYPVDGYYCWPKGAESATYKFRYGSYASDCWIDDLGWIRLSNEMKARVFDLASKR